MRIVPMMHGCVYLIIPTRDAGMKSVHPRAMNGGVDGLQRAGR